MHWVFWIAFALFILLCIIVNFLMYNEFINIMNKLNLKCTCDDKNNKEEKENIEAEVKKEKKENEL